MIRSLRLHAPLLTFGLSLTLIYAAAFVILSRLATLDRPDLIAGALTLDLTLLVPGLYYLLLVRRRGWPAITTVPMFIASVFLAGWLIPDSQHHVLDLMHYGAGLAEIALVGIIAYKTIRLRRAYRERVTSGLDVYTGLRESARPILGSFAGTILAYEVAVFYYLLFGWRRAPDPGPSSFGYHRRSAYGVVVAAVMIGGCIELIAVHLLVNLWSSVAAWILTGISAYALLWLVGDTHAIRLRPIGIAGGKLHVRLGLRWTVEIPVDRIRAIDTTVHEPLPRRTPEYLKALLLGGPNLRIELRSAVDALGPYGLKRRVRTIDLQIDEPERLEAAIAG